MMGGIKADSLLIERLGYGWTKDKPAPWEVGLLFACGRLANGGRLSVRDLAAYMGWSKRRGWQCLQDAWEFNRRAGFTAADDVMAECIQQDPIGPAKAVWDVPDDLVQQAYQRCAVRDELFALRASG